MVNVDDMRFYQGISMKSLFQPGDCLFLKKIPISLIRAGDIVVYKCSDTQGDEKERVHRVVNISSKGLVTRGDNNRFIDETMITDDVLIGKVTHFERKGKSHKIYGGYLGIIYLRFLRVRFHTYKIIKSILRKPYGWLRKSGLVIRFWNPDIKKVFLKNENGLLIKYISGKKIVAKYWPEKGRFYCRKPYDLVIHYPDIFDCPGLKKKNKLFTNDTSEFFNLSNNH